MRDNKIDGKIVRDPQNKWKHRNIGIIAHIDAGKTTTTERILFYTGRIKKMGEVHEGAATTDFDTQEQERGITIYSAAVSCQWTYKNDIYEYNIIDTPGHVDFTIEVQRSVRVLDGAICVFDGANGAEAQTLTVWKQADAQKVPRLVFINKMDKSTARFDYAVGTIKSKLGASPLVLQIPVGSGTEFTGLVDLVSMRYLVWVDKQYSEQPMSEDLRARAESARETLISELMNNAPEDLADRFVMGEEFTEEELKQEIRRQTLELISFPVFCGSSYKNVGVQTLLDAVVDYLPSPMEKQVVTESGVPVQCDDNAPFVGLIFKVVKDQFAGRLSYMRIYSGSIARGSDYMVARTRNGIRVSSLFRMYAGDRERIDSAKAGDIVAIAGQYPVITGDTIYEGNERVVLEKIAIPQRVISASLAPKDKGDINNLIDALKDLTLEDPSFSFEIDQETNQIIVFGMGELHLEIKYCLLKDRDIEVIPGEPRVQYRETIIGNTFRHTEELKKQTGGRGQYAVVIVDVIPLPDPNQDLEFEWAITGMDISKTYEKPIEQGIRSAAECGILAKGKLTGVKFKLVGGKQHEVDSSALAFEIAGRNACLNAMHYAKEHGNLKLLEPIMFTVIANIRDKYFGDITGFVNSLQGKIVATQSGEIYTVIDVRIALNQMIGFISKLRRLSAGEVTYSAELEKYDFVPDAKLLAIAKASGITFDTDKK